MVDARIIRSKARVRAAFIDLLQNRELEDVTVRDVSIASGVGYSTFYRHYPTKDDLIAEIAELEVSEWVEASYPVLLAEPPAVVCELSARHIHGRRHLWIALTSGTAAGILREKLITGMMAHAFDAKIGSGFFPLGVSTSMCATIMVELLTWWLRQNEYASPDYLAEALERMIVRPIFNCW